MVEIGSIIEAVVTRVEHFGIFLQHDGEEVVVLLPEFSWEPVHDLRQLVRVGDLLQVLVVRYNYQKKQIVGSIRRLQQEKNPYREIARLAPETVLHGVVMNTAGSDLSIRLPNGAWGYLAKRLLPTEPRIGETVAVKVDCVEVDEGRLILAPSSRSEYGAPGTVSEIPLNPIGRV